MSTSAISGVGAQFKRENDGSSGEFTAISEIRRISRSGRVRKTLDATDLDSTDGYNEFITGFRDGGSWELEMYWTEAGYTQFNDDFESDDSHNYQVVLPDAGDFTIEFAGYVIDVGNMEMTPEDTVVMPVIIKVTGADSITT